MTRKEQVFRNISCNNELKKVLFVKNDLDLASEFVTRLLKQDILIKQIFDMDICEKNFPIISAGVNSNKEYVLIIVDLIKNNDSIILSDKFNNIIKKSNVCNANIVKIFNIILDLTDKDGNIDEIIENNDKLCIHKFNVKKSYDFFKQNEEYNIEEWNALIMLTLNEKELKKFSKKEAFLLAFYNNLVNIKH